MSKKGKNPFRGINNFMARNKVWTSFIYGVGASVVLIGALFKILHLEGANELLTVGMSVEAFLFFMSAFEPIHKEYDWEIVYPQLTYAEMGEVPTEEEKHQGLASLGLAADITAEDMQRLTEGIKKLGETAAQLQSLQELSAVNSEFLKRMTAANNSLEEFHKANTNSMSVIQEGAEKMRSVYGAMDEENMSRLNATFASSVEDMIAFKEGTAKLKSHVDSLNSVYGNMLSAFNMGK